ncbi:MAG: undecaprenyl-diphosphate phosphatase [Thermoflexales bacterium]|nr:undecaprenyl-diphosphate phosphatase [Thermoflexales bacterium]MDW8350416.1 undecaprenyl-diphosphate phosphatase [Anaerolineae bacterium]
MDLSLLFKALVMGVVEGLTEFLPISSTGHLIVAGKLIGFPQAIAATFEIFIQLGAILAVVVYFARDLFNLLRRARRDRRAQGLLLNVIIAFIPAAVVGVLFSRLIKENLFNPVTVAFALIFGGAVMLLVEWRPRQAVTHHVEATDWRQALAVGLAQIVSLWPGFSRSASTIIGGLLAGMDRPTALRFSFYLSIPTMLAATVFDFVRSLDAIHPTELPAFAVGLCFAFLVALVVIKFFLGYVARHNLKPFAWYRIVVGIALLALAAAGFFG